jgi:hypothetical protein
VVAPWLVVVGSEKDAAGACSDGDRHRLGEELMRMLTIDDLSTKLRGDRELAPALWLLGSPMLADKIPDAWVNIERRFINWEQLFARSEMWSTGEKMYVALAFNLWSSSTAFGWINPDLHLNPYRWVSTLTDPSRLLEAIGFSCGLVLLESAV